MDAPKRLFWRFMVTRRKNKKKDALAGAVSLGGNAHDRMPMSNKKLPDAEFLRQLFSYERDTGLLRWRPLPASMFPDRRSHKTWTTKFCGEIAGYVFENSGMHYREVCFKKNKWRAHRVVWKMHYGVEPPEIIDHVDGDGTNNKIENLRAATVCQNGWNVKRSTRNKSGYKGVSFNNQKKKWRAAIRVLKKDILIGYYKTPEEASDAYQKASASYHGGFYRKT